MRYLIAPDHTKMYALCVINYFGLVRELRRFALCGGHAAARERILFFSARSSHRFMNNILLRDQFSHAQVESQFIHKRATMQAVCVCYLPICLSCNMRLHFIKVEESMCQVSGATQFIRQATTASHKKCSEHAYVFSLDRQLFKLSREISQISAAREMDLIFSAINQKPTEARI